MVVISCASSRSPCLLLHLFYYNVTVLCHYKIIFVFISFNDSHLFSHFVTMFSNLSLFTAVKAFWHYFSRSLWNQPWNVVASGFILIFYFFQWNSWWAKPLVLPSMPGQPVCQENYDCVALPRQPHHTPQEVNQLEC